MAYRRIESVDLSDPTVFPDCLRLTAVKSLFPDTAILTPDCRHEERGGKTETKPKGPTAVDLPPPFGGLGRDSGKHAAVEEGVDRAAAAAAANGS